MAVEAQRHQTSLAVWDVPSPAVAGERFTIKAGVKSTADCNLRGRRIEVCDAAGVVIGEGLLGESPWPKTRALYWTELSLPAPVEGHMATLSLRFQASGIEPPHADAVSRFSVALVRAPEHTLTVKVVEKETAAPIANMQLRLGPYCATTGHDGVAALRLCKGNYGLRIWKVGYDAPAIVVEIKGDAFVQVDAAIVPEESADRAWKM